MPKPHPHDGFRELMSRIKRGGDKAAWDELLSRVLPQLWRAAIEKPWATAIRRRSAFWLAAR